MPRASRTKPASDSTYAAWQSVALGMLPGAPVVARGTKLRGVHAYVQSAPCAFVAVDDSAGTEARINQRYAEELAELAEAHYTPPPQPPEPLRDEDMVVAIRGVGGLGGIPAGARVPKTDPIVKANRDAFVAVVPDGLQREDAVEARVTLTVDGEPVVYAGQWVHRDDPVVERDPHAFGPLDDWD